MSQKQSLLFFVVASLLLGLVYVMGTNAKRAYMVEKGRLESFTKEAKSLSTLKERFANNQNRERTLKMLHRIVAPSKEFKKSDVHVFVYENLAASTLNNLVRKIENSTLEIKRLEIDRINEASATLTMEIKK